MKSIAISSLVALAAAAADPQITARAELAPRQDDPAFLGFVSASSFSDARSCDFPATLSRSGSLAQCCAPSQACNFWSSCSAGTLFAGQTSLRCDQGYCNTALLVNTLGASSANSYLGCWATSLGEAPFTIVRDVSVTGSVGGSTMTSAGSSAARSTGAGVSSRTSAAGSAVSSAVSEVASPTPSTGAAGVVGVEAYAGVLGLMAVALGML